MHAPTQPAITFDADHATYSVALWSAVAGLLELPADEHHEIDVPVPDWAAAGSPWTLTRRGEDLAFLATRHADGATLTQLTFAGRDVDAAAVDMLAFDRAHPLQLPASLFAQDAAR